MSCVSLGFEKILAPSRDPSPPLPFWDKIRLLFHGRLTMYVRQMTILLHASLDPYNTTEEMELTWSEVAMDWTNGKRKVSMKSSGCFYLWHLLRWFLICNNDCAAQWATRWIKKMKFYRSHQIMLAILLIKFWLWWYLEWAYWCKVFVCLCITVKIHSICDTVHSLSWWQSFHVQIMCAVFRLVSAVRLAKLLTGICNWSQPVCIVIIEASFMTGCYEYVAWNLLNGTL